MMLLALPHELVEHILLLATESIQTCRLVNKALNEIIQSSVLLQYSQACEVAGVIDNPLSPLSYPERLEALKKREDAWRNLKPVFEMTIKVNHQPSSLYGLTEGAYFLGDHNQKDLHYCQLPSSPQDDPQWKRIPSHVTEEGLPGKVVNIATDIYEHDLIVKAIISSQIGNQEDAMQQYSLDLVLLKFSTGEYHPLARQPRIPVQTSSKARPRVSPGIVGDNLVLVIHNGNYNNTHPDKLIIFDWKSGHKRLEHKATCNPYFEFAFISPELLLVPNRHFYDFEVWHIPPNFKPPVQILCLRIPDIESSYSLQNITCSGEPKPFLHSMPHLPLRPFSPSPESSIIIANLHLYSHSRFHGYRPISLTLVMHRRALIDTIQKWTSTPLEQDITQWFKNRLDVRKIADLDDGSVTAYSKLVAIGLDTMSWLPTFGSQSPGLCTGSLYKFPQVKWARWGPPLSRWFKVYDGELEPQWPTAFNGQRWAFCEPNPTHRKLKIRVADFNPHNLRRHREMTERFRREGKDNGWNGYTGKDEGFEKLCDGYIFSEEVYMGLKCVVYRLPDAYDFDAVLMDGERLLGLKLAGTHVEWIRVLYFG